MYLYETAGWVSSPCTSTYYTLRTQEMATKFIGTINKVRPFMKPRVGFLLLAPVLAILLGPHDMATEFTETTNKVRP